MPQRQHDLFEWLIPALLAALIGVLGWMAINIQDMSRSLAIAVTKIDEHERRLLKLELDN